MNTAMPYNAAKVPMNVAMADSHVPANHHGGCARNNHHGVAFTPPKAAKKG
jgi:hypothetical protein